MTQIGIDFVALAIIGVAMIIGQIRQIPPRVRFFVMAAAFAIVAIYRVRQGTDPFNLAVVGVCVVFCLMNAVKGLRYQNPSS